MIFHHTVGLKNRLWQHRDEQDITEVYAVIDAARGQHLYPEIVNSSTESMCIFRGKLAEELAWVAPYVVHLEYDHAFTTWLIENSWGQSQCIFIRTPASLKELCRHLRTFITVYDEEGKSYFFRFYDPRVLRVYLPTCNSDELKAVFGPIECFILEEKDPAVILEFTTDGKRLQFQRITLR